jgi:hypothetical protein
MLLAFLNKDCGNLTLIVPNRLSMTNLQTDAAGRQSATSPSLGEHENQIDTSNQYLPLPAPDGGYG